MKADGVPLWMEWTVLSALALLSALGAAYEYALLSASRSRLNRMLEKKSALVGGFVARAAANDAAIIVRADLLYFVTATAFIVYGLWMFLPDGGGVTFSRYLRLGLPLFASQAAFRGMAYLVGYHYAERFVVALAVPMAVLTLPLAPVASAALWARKVLTRAAGLEEDVEDEREADVIDAVSDGQLDGVVGDGQKRMIEGIFEFKDADVADIIVPRTEMTTISADTPLSEAVGLAMRKGFSRLPAYRGTRDHIVGIFHIRDAMPYWDKPESGRPSLATLLRPPLFVPETKKIPELLAEMSRGQSHMAVVLDEYGGTAGLVTLEDMLEEIVGDIQDEFDAEDAKSDGEVRRVDDRTLVAEGHVHVADVNKLLGEEIIPEDDDYETVAGFVLDNLGHIPGVGESFTYDGQLLVRVLQADERRVRRVRLRLYDGDDEATAVE